MATKNEVVEPVSDSPPGSSKSIKNTANEDIIDGNNRHTKETFLSSAINDAATLPKGTLDPVYEAKARVLNHAVSLSETIRVSLMTDMI